MSPLTRIVATACCFAALAATSAASAEPAHDHDPHRHADRASPPTLAVFDANGGYVGSPRARDATFGVDMTINGALVFVRIERVSRDGFSGISASQFRWRATDCTVESNCPNPVSVDCGGALCPARPSFAIRRANAVTLYIASPSNSTGGSPVRPLWPVEATYDLSAHHPEPLTVRY